MKFDTEYLLLLISMCEELREEIDRMDNNKAEVVSGLVVGDVDLTALEHCVGSMGQLISDLTTIVPALSYMHGSESVKYALKNEIKGKKDV